MIKCCFQLVFPAVFTLSLPRRVADSNASVCLVSCSLLSFVLAYLLTSWTYLGRFRVHIPQNALNCVQIQLYTSKSEILWTFLLCPWLLAASVILLNISFGALLRVLCMHFCAPSLPHYFQWHVCSLELSPASWFLLLCLSLYFGMESSRLYIMPLVPVVFGQRLTCFRSHYCYGCRHGGRCHCCHSFVADIFYHCSLWLLLGTQWQC